MDSPKDVDNSEFYEILSVPKEANQDDIKKAYRKKVIKAHPDKGGDPEEFKKLQAAYEVLSHPEKREIYDKYGIDGLREDGGSGMDRKLLTCYSLAHTFCSIRGSIRRSLRRPWWQRRQRPTGPEKG